jgi:dUTP pyrophosphatase
MAKIYFKKLNENAELPRYASSSAACMDICALCGEEGISIAPMQRTLVHTGLSVQLEDPLHAGFLFARSGLSLNSGLCLANGVGVIDADYRGELCVALVNISNETVLVKNGQRVAQFCVIPLPHLEICEITQLAKSARGEGGFGSTGE